MGQEGRGGGWTSFPFLLPQRAQSECAPREGARLGAPGAGGWYRRAQ
jgi:hypothetical protein